MAEKDITKDLATKDIVIIIQLKDQLRRRNLQIKQLRQKAKSLDGIEASLRGYLNGHFTEMETYHNFNR